MNLFFEAILRHGFFAAIMTRDRGEKAEPNEKRAVEWYILEDKLDRSLTLIAEE